MLRQNTGVSLNVCQTLMPNFSKKYQKSYASTVQESFDRPDAENFPALITNDIVLNGRSKNLNGMFLMFFFGNSSHIFFMR